MLYVCSSVKKYQTFKELFFQTHKNVIDLSKVSVNKLSEECDSIIAHHSDCAVFFGYIEPGWMLDPVDQTRIRKCFRKFSVGMVTGFPESIPHSWKNGIDTFYFSVNQNESSNSFNDGSSIQDQSNN